RHLAVHGNANRKRERRAPLTIPLGVPPINMAIETASGLDVSAEQRPAPVPVMHAPHAVQRIRVDGKHFKVGEERFRFKGVTYGTFLERGDCALFPERPQIRKDFEAMASRGFTVVRTYTAP